MSQEHYELLKQNPANFVPLSPLSIIKRTAKYFGEKTSIIYNSRHYTWTQTYERSIQLCSALVQKGIKSGDTVSAMLANTPEMIEAHFGVPMSGAVLNTINTRLGKNVVGYILKHSDCKLILVDRQFSKVVKEAMEQEKISIPTITINDSNVDFESYLNEENYEEFLIKGDKQFKWKLPGDEWKALTLNYTSGTSGHPKGVVYHHRGSYLMTMGTVAAWQLPLHPTYLYTVPLFHCNGWGHAWTMCMMAGTIICCRTVSPAFVFEMVEKHKVTHFGGAPIVLSMLVNADPNEQKKFDHRVKVMTAGAPPPPAILEKMGQLGFDVMQVYGLTETYGHITHCLWREEWDDLSNVEQAEIKSWQGIPLPMTEEVDLQNFDTGKSISNKEQEPGEIVIRGNTVMKGYYKDMEATQKAFDNGWFHSGDVAVWQDKHYLQVTDRLKDVIISGGENVSSVEVENVLYEHPGVGFAAVVAMPDEKWGEVPCAFIELKEGQTTTEAELIVFCREKIAGFKTPKKIVFETLPKTATGKIQKFILRDKMMKILNDKI